MALAGHGVLGLGLEPTVAAVRITHDSSLEKLFCLLTMPDYSTVYNRLWSDLDVG
jgi:hypothetical protein